MSRSNPSENGIANPAVRWFEWNGEKGLIRYYDKEAKRNVDMGADFTFILLDQVASVRGWHDDSQSGIYSNEVKDTTQEALVVKAFKGGIIAEGVYRDIKNAVKAAGGSYTANCYLAFKDGGELKIGVLRLKGSALGAWMEFSKEHRNDLYSAAIRVKGSVEGKKGRVVFHTPVLKIASVDKDTDRAAHKLDEELQKYFEAYFKRTKRQQAEAAPKHEPPTEDGFADGPDDDAYAKQYEAEAKAALTDDDIPF